MWVLRISIRTWDDAVTCVADGLDVGMDGFSWSKEEKHLRGQWVSRHPGLSSVRLFRGENSDYWGGGEAC